MFVSVVCDIANEDHEMEVYELLGLYGFEQVIKNVFESSRIKENTLMRLKRDIDKATDFYDKVRFYQFPMEDTLVITFLSQKKWRKTIVRE
jgi:CRISPR-associated protein Cas2